MAFPFIRMMSNSPTKHLFAVYAPDYTNPGVLECRVSVREKHLRSIDEKLDSGIISTYLSLQYGPVLVTIPICCAEFGGALLTPELTDESGRKKMTGSLMFYDAESIEEVRKTVESDIYYTSGVVRLLLSRLTVQPSHSLT